MASLFDTSRWTALAASALIITACGGDGDAPSTEPASAKTKQSAATKPKPAATRPPGDRAQLIKLVTERAYALEQGDSAGFVATATGGQVAKDKRAIANARALPIQDVQMTAQATEVEGDTGTLRVDMVYSFEGLDTEFVKTSRMTVKKTPEGWRVSRDRPSAGTLAPWEYTRYKARTSKHFIALAPSSLKVGSLMTDLEKGRSRMMKGLPGINPPDRLLVIVARNGKDTKALTKDLKTLNSLVAVAEAQVFTEGPAQKVTDVGGQRVFVLWRSYGNRPRAERRQVVAHELVHAALAKRAGGRVPVWLSEGIALYASGDKRAADAGALLSGAQLKDSSKQASSEKALSLARLSNPNAMDRMGAIPLSFAYSYASAAAYAIADKHGGGKALLKLYAAYNSEKIKGKPGRKLTNKVFRKVLKKSIDEVEADVNSYARSNSPF